LSSVSIARRAGRALFDNPYLLLALASLFWSGNHIVGRAVADQVPPFALSTLRWIIGALLLWPFARRHVARDWPLIRSHAGILLMLGLIGGTLFSALNYLSLQLTTALNVSVFNSLGPVLIAAVAAISFRDRLSRLQVAGIATSMLGVVAIVTRLDWATLTALRFNSGDLLVLFNMLVFAFYSVYLRRRPAIHWLSFIFILSLISGIGTAPLFAWEQLSGAYLPWTWTMVLAVGYVALFPSLGAYIFWNRGIELIGANRSGVFLHLVPLYSAVLATVLLGEQLHAYHVLGFALILTGVRLATRGAPRVTATE
jgi:drug/metabolite transporter (DMT)-like permease